MLTGCPRDKCFTFDIFTTFHIHHVLHTQFTISAAITLEIRQQDFILQDVQNTAHYARIM
jgi:hypothetical protein